MVRISLCMIVRDEEECLPVCLASVAGVVDEICIADTGSRDRTIEIARGFGARVTSVPWTDDFSAARNASFAMASGDWILVLDADESLAGGDARAKLEAFTYAYPVRAGQVTIVDPQEGGALRSRVSRFFPVSASPNYRGRFHEQPHFGDQLAPPALLPLEVAHTGYRPEAIARKDKVARNRRFLERLAREDPADSYVWYQLGRTHWVGGDLDAALEAFATAIEHVAPEAPYLALLLELTGHCLRRKGRSLEALTLLRQVSGAFLDRADMCFLEALLALDVGQLELAEERFQRCLALPEAEGRGGSSSEMARTWGPAYHLGVLRECLVLPQDAREYYELALIFHPGHAESRAALARLDAIDSSGESMVTP